MQGIPWESTLSLRDCEVYRVPSLHTILAAAARQKTGPPVKETSPSAEKANCREQSADGDCCGPSRGTFHDGQQRPEYSPVFSMQVEPHDAVFMMNPSADLKGTEERFAKFCAAIKGWQVRADSY